MMLKLRGIKAVSILVTITGLLVHGCVASTPEARKNTATVSVVNRVEPGDQVQINYTCRTIGGRVIETTDMMVANDASIKKSRVFTKRPAYFPASLIAGQNKQDPLGEKLKPLVPEIEARPAHALVGKPKNTSLELVIASDVPEGMEPMERFITKKRVAIKPVVYKTPRDLFERANGREPVLNEIFEIDGKPSSQIIGFDEKNVLFKNVFEEEVFDTEWGMARSVVRGDKVISTLEAEEGTLVRAGGFIGRISKVGEQTLTIDYGYPFGEKQLKCMAKVLDTGNGDPK